MRLEWRGFFCGQCRLTVSYLPHFALTYRLLHVDMVEAYFDGKKLEPVQEKWRELLGCYWRKFQQYAPQLRRVVGAGLGLSPTDPAALWSWLKAAVGSLAQVTARLVESWKLTLFNSYRCHRPGQRRHRHLSPEKIALATAGVRSLPRLATHTQPTYS